MSRIEQLIDEIETYIDGCKPQAFSNNKKIIVDKDEMEDLLSELRHRTPDEIKKYQKIISNQEAILSNAKDQADAMIAEAQKQTEEMVNEHEIMQRAYERAAEIIDQANRQAQEIVNRAAEEATGVQDGAIHYTDELLKNVQTIIDHAIENSNARQASFSDSLQQIYDVIASNRKELNPETLIVPVDEDDEQEEE